MTSSHIKTNRNLQGIVKAVYQMQETEYLLSSSHNLIFLFQKQQIKLYALIMKIHNRKKLQSTAINHSADIDYRGFLRIYRECTNKKYSFVTIDTTLPADDLLNSL